MPLPQSKILRQKNYAVLTALVVFFALVFGLTIAKMVPSAQVSSYAHLKG